MDEINGKNSIRKFAGVWITILFLNRSLIHYNKWNLWDEKISGINMNYLHFKL
jgi:hypothetical protein